ncbi:MAG: DUF3416 domain-containing protein [Micromonosporaceae bacterium]|nr:DUF3416 domain-containing protein [Micromonosporaceae bacterium]
MDEIAPAPGRIPIEDVFPVVACGRHPAKAVVGERTPIAATVYREGHDALGCDVVWRCPDGTPRAFTRMSAGRTGTDRWHAEIVPDSPGMWTFHVEAWSDPYLTWKNATEKKIAAGQGVEDLCNELASGARVLAEAARQASGADDCRALREAARAIGDERLDLAHRVAPALAVAEVMWRNPVRRLVSRSDTCQLWVDRPRALYSAWYEFFPRSEPRRDADGEAVRGRDAQPEHGTFATAANRLDAIADMGFDIVYLPPIHPIGKVNRKGKNNTLVAEPADVGSPWAIGSDEGGHDAIHPQLGGPQDLKKFVARANELGMEVALDLALQCAPDHPWVKAHPEWFTTLPDGSVAYAENPPKKYQDIYPVNFDNDPEGSHAEVLRVVRHWIGCGVSIFRVDNPHTKPLPFWHWLIAEVKREHPDAIFLSEAFTRPAMMHGLAKIGFTQSYTYFTWRTAKQELTEYCGALLGALHYMRPNFWVNTPDILHATLQHGGPPMFKIRAVLASTLAPSWGVYSGYELYEHVPRPGSEEHIDNEKYELKPRNWLAAEREGRTLAPYLRKLNQIRRENPALHWIRNLRFHGVDNDALMCWSKRHGDNTVLVICSLDSHNVHWGNTSLDMPELGFDWHERFSVRDEVTGETYDWGEHNAVRLDPHHEPAHIFTVHRYP